VFATGVQAGAANPEGAKALQRFLIAPAADGEIKAAGLERP
jgi:hypothetical protein